MSRFDKDAAMTAELERLSRAGCRGSERYPTIQAIARTDLSMGAYPDLAKQRFWEITVFRVRPGHDADLRRPPRRTSRRARSTPGAQFRTYEVIAGMPQPTFVLFSSVTSYGAFDQMLQDNVKTMQAFTPER